MRKEKKYIVWQNYDINLEDYRDWLEEDYPEITDEYEQYRICADENDACLEDERANLNIYLDEPILAIGDLGFWLGRAPGYKFIKGNIKGTKISDCLYSDCDYCEWYVDELGDFRLRESHHDGTNYILFREFKPGTSEEQRENLMAKIYNGTATRRDITRVTRKIGDRIADVYGWKI